MPITDEDVLRELLHRATDDVHAPSAVAAGIVTRHRRRLRSTRILSITTTSVAAAAVLAAVVVTRVGPPAPGHAQPPAALPSTDLPAVKLPPVKLTAVQVLDQLSVAAADAPQPTGRYIALTEIDMYPDAVYPTSLPSEFLNPKLSPSRQQQLQQMVMEYGSERTVVFDSVTGDVWAYQRGTGRAQHRARLRRTGRPPGPSSPPGPLTPRNCGPCWSGRRDRRWAWISSG